MREEQSEVGLWPGADDIEQVAIALVVLAVGHAPCRHLKEGLEVVLIPAPPEHDEHVLELLALHAVLGLKRGVALVVLRKLGDFGIRHGV
ncbi:hypothetical protein D3C72_2108030 [compost metagenome]